MNDKNDKWYIADMILEHEIEDDPRNVIHINSILIRANSSDDAYDKASELGKESEWQFQNTDGKMVNIIFRGFEEIIEVYEDPLEHGTELYYNENINIPANVLKKWISKKKDLSIFRNAEPIKGTPNYMPESVMKDLEDVGFSRDEIVKDIK